MKKGGRSIALGYIIFFQNTKGLVNLPLVEKWLVAAVVVVVVASTWNCVVGDE